MSASNPLRGEASLGEHKLLVDFNGFCSLEAAMGKTVPQILALMDAGLGFSDLRTFVRVFAENGMTEDEAGELIGQVTYQEALLAVSTAINGFFATQKKDKPARPQKAA